MEDEKLWCIVDILTDAWQTKRPRQSLHDQLKTIIDKAEKRGKADGITQGKAEGIAQGRSEAAEAYCDHICAMLSCRHTGKDKLACGIQHLILGTVSDPAPKG